MAMMVCPKCGFNQEHAAECLRCGIVFARIHETDTFTYGILQIGRPAGSSPGLLRRCYRVFRWITLGVLVLALSLILRRGRPPDVATDPGGVRRAEVKVQAFQSAVERGRLESLELDESELNGWMNANLALKGRNAAAAARPPATLESVTSLAKKALAATDEQVEQVESSVREVKIALGEDSLRAYVVFDARGVDLSLDLEGRIVVRDGYLSFEPTGGKLGSLPLLAGTLQEVASRLFESPENKEKFRLPPEIRDVRVAHGRLIVSSY